jgi:hypothetical protein
MRGMLESRRPRARRVSRSKAETAATVVVHSCAPMLDSQLRICTRRVAASGGRGVRAPGIPEVEGARHHSDTQIKDYTIFAETCLPASALTQRQKSLQLSFVTATAKGQRAHRRIRRGWRSGLRVAVGHSSLVHTSCSRAQQQAPHDGAYLAALEALVKLGGHVRGAPQPQRAKTEQRVGRLGNAERHRVR